MRVVSTFAGIGGFDLAFERVGFEVVAHVEQDEHCRALLAGNFPSARSFIDVRKWYSLPECDVLTGGWPCQDLSQAGLRAGLAGARSGLFYQFTRIAYELAPPFIVWENVPGLLTSDNGRDMLRVVREFQRIGYSGGWRTLDAQYFGLAQRRGRVFGVFARRDIGAGCCAEILSLAEGMRWNPAPRREAGKEIAGTLGGSSQSGGFRTTGLDNQGAFVVGTLTPGAHPGSYNGQDAYSGHLIPFAAHRASDAGAVSSKWAKGTGGPAGDECYNLIAFHPTQDPISRADGTTHALSCGSGHGQASVAVAFKPSHYTRDKDGSPQEVYPPLSADADKGDQEAVIFQPRLGGVRRLTPRECERLQGFPDDWTAGFSDSVRYRMLGNAVAVPVAQWIARRLFRHLTTKHHE
jgi:DNA (cytosine-5)-methyltransferase 1